ncbi:MAG: DUF2905 domain-containing protein [Chlorobiaceae bacterium]|nr:DUF2905 domain-containing protein [Chlorobiaceae bacterium]
MFSDSGKIVVVAGLITVVLGLFLMNFESSAPSRWLNWMGNLPLDIRIEKSNFRFYFPIGTSIILSVLLNLILYLVNKFIN